MARGHAVVRVLAALANSAMVLYIYAVHLWEFNWDNLGSAGNSRRLADYVWRWELEPAFEHLRVLSFSDAMLQKLDIYMLVGTPVAIVYFILERNRIRWLQAVVMQSLPIGQAKRAASWLEAYLWTLSAGLVCILMLSCFHIELPRAHYMCAAGAFGFCMLSICVYMSAPVDFSLIAAQANSDDQHDDDFAVWALWLRNLVRPTIKVVLALHVVTLVAAIWKIERLGDNFAALIFGIFETSVIVAYQLFLAVFAFDDAMVGRGLSQKQEPLKQNPGSLSKTARLLAACQ